jgi:cytosine/adenosine deaminase-related metal-dependent hydrolase
MASPFSLDSDKAIIQEMAKVRLQDKTEGHSEIYTPNSLYSDANSTGQLEKIVGVRIPCKPSSTLWDISIADGRISSVDPHRDSAQTLRKAPGTLDGANRLLAPSLCHAHIHIDKCFLLQDPKYSDLQIEEGDFQEAMELTRKAKSRFQEDDLLKRGRQLIEESIRHGVTAMRAFVEVDGGVQFQCLDAGLRLKKEFKDRCEVQICAFAQLPLFSGEDEGEEVRKLMLQAACFPGVEVLGSTPYVEQDVAKSKRNVDWIIGMARLAGKHLDLHLDYYLDKEQQPLIYTVLHLLRNEKWAERSSKQVTLGHCTRLTHFQEADWWQLRHLIGDLPISFVGLPTSDLFMMRSKEGVRGTLPVVEMIEKYGFETAIAINNVGNAFTPHGNCDPLSIATMGVGIYQAGTKKNAEILYASSLLVLHVADRACTDQ